MDATNLDHRHEASEKVGRHGRPLGLLLPIVAAVVVVTSSPSHAATGALAQADVIRFSNGARITDIRIRNGYETPTQWRLDGTPDQGSGFRFDPNYRHIEVATNYEGPSNPLSESAETQSLVAKLGDIESHSGSSTGGTATGGTAGFPGSPRGADTYNMNFDFEVPNSLHSADLVFGERVGTYKQIATSHKILSKRAFNLPHPSDPHELSIGYDKPTIYFYMLPSAKGKALRLVAYDANGQEVRLKTEMWFDFMDTAAGPTGRVWCDDLPKTVHHFTLEASDYEWKKIKGVHLYPNSEGGK